jgi:predicted ArsR family transcriptional regulator
MEITVQEAAKRLGVTPGRVRQLVAEGRIKVRYLTPRMMMFDAKELAKVKHRPTGRPPKRKGR